MAMERSPYRV